MWVKNRKWVDMKDDDTKQNDMNYIEIKINAYKYNEIK